MLEALTSLLTLTVLEVVLSIDNLVVIAVLVGKLPKERQATARYAGMTLAAAQEDRRDHQEDGDAQQQERDRVGEEHRRIALAD